MAKVTVHEGNKAETSLIYVKDARGRKLGLRKLPFLEEFRIIETLGAEVSSNTTYMSMINPLLYLAEIDGMQIEIPRTKLQVEALIQRADRDGFIAVVEGIRNHFNGTDDEFKEKVKNVEGTPNTEAVSGS